MARTPEQRTVDRIASTLDAVTNRVADKIEIRSHKLTAQNAEEQIMRNREDLQFNLLQGGVISADELAELVSQQSGSGLRSDTGSNARIQESFIELNLHAIARDVANATAQEEDLRNQKLISDYNAKIKSKMSDTALVMRALTTALLK